jgi:hypothetical protein
VRRLHARKCLRARHVQGHFLAYLAAMVTVAGTLSKSNDALSRLRISDQRNPLSIARR